MENKELNIDLNTIQKEFTKEEKKLVKTFLKEKINKFLEPYIKASKKEAKTNEFYRTHGTIFSEKRMNEIVKIYDSVIKTINKEIDNLEKDRSKTLQKNIKDIVKKYDSTNSKELTLLVTTFWEQPIETEYDIFILINSKVFNEKEKKVLFNIYKEYQLEISKKYLELVDYLINNKAIWYYKKLKELLWWLNNRYLIHNFEYREILTNQKIKKENYKNLYKDEIREYVIYKKDLDKYLKLKESEYKKFFNDYSYKWNKFFNYKWITIETFDENFKNNDEFISKINKEKFINNKNISVLTNKEQIILRNTIRNNIKYIKEWIKIYLEKNGFKNKIDNSFLLNHEYLDNDKTHNKILLKIKE